MAGYFHCVFTCVASWRFENRYHYLINHLSHPRPLQREGRNDVCVVHRIGGTIGTFDSANSGYSIKSLGTTYTDDAEGTTCSCSKGADGIVHEITDLMARDSSSMSASVVAQLVTKRHKVCSSSIGSHVSKSTFDMSC